MVAHKLANLLLREAVCALIKLQKRVESCGKIFVTHKNCHAAVALEIGKGVNTKA